MKKHPIYTEKNDCQDCYKCLRQCPVKAIKFFDANASIIKERCVYCGHCIEVCPVGAKKMRSEKQNLITAFTDGHKVIACLAPTYISEFDDVSQAVLIRALKELGFVMVSETALGAAVVASECANWLEAQKNGVYISSCCPTVVDYIHKYYPALKDTLTPFLSPMQTHAKMLKEKYGSNYEIAFVGPCVSKKYEADQINGLTDYVLTFKELRQWLDEEIFGWTSLMPAEDDVFKPNPAAKSNFFPVEGGMIANMKSYVSNDNQQYLSFSGMGHLKEIMDDISANEITEKLFLELMACEGGCIKGRGTCSKKSIFLKNKKIREQVSQVVDKIEEVDITVNVAAPLAVKETDYTEGQLALALRSVGKYTLNDQLNCEGCGYNSCRDFGRAILNGFAERAMCTTYMRRVGQGKATALLKKIPSGVVIADKNLKIMDTNSRFIDILGDDAMQLYEVTSTLAGADLRKLISYTKLFDSVLQSGEEMVEQDVMENGRYLRVTVVTIHPYEIVCGIVQDMRDPEVNKEIVLDHTRKVIQQNMEVVQKIAFLLGENASYTESMLNSILESHEKGETT